jgi:DNA repair protein SbcD/Mre11
MKLFHIADLHLGKRVNEFDMIEAQRDILNKIIEAIKTHKPKALIIAGDVYDRSVPGAEAVKLFDDFLNELKLLDIVVYIIAGNHDSKERLSFASGILEDMGYHIATHIKSHVFKHSLSDRVDVYMIPFLRPSDVRMALDSSVTNYDLAFKEMIDLIELDKSKFNILVAHQFFTFQNIRPEESESEIVSVGGLDNIDTSYLEAFDYVALGHIHRPQSIGGKKHRYAGSILKYSQSEVNHTKSISVIDIEGKEFQLSLIDLIPKQDMVHIEGYMADILVNNNYDTEAYTYITLLDEGEVVDALSRLRSKFPYLMSLRFENLRTSYENKEVLSYESLNEMSPLALFDAFYERQNNTPLSQTQKDFVQKILEDLYETH